MSRRLHPLSLENVRWLLASMALVLAPMFLHMSPWVPGFAALLGGWRYLLAMQRRPLPGWRILLPLTLLGAAGIFIAAGASFGRDASVELLTLMLAMKLLESANRRDAMLLISLSWFLAVTTLLYTQSLLMGLYLALPVTGLTLTMVGLHHPQGDMPLRLRWRWGGGMLALALPVMLVLFVLFPRLSGPLWQAPGDATKGMTGLSDSMSPGSIGELSLSDEIAFRAQFEGNVPASGQRYWRGPVFWHFDGQTWHPGLRAAALPTEPLKTPTETVGYTVTLEPHHRAWLFALDLPLAAPQNAVLRSDYQLLAQQPVDSRLRYHMRSSLAYRLQPQLDPATRQFGLQLPHEGNPQARALARSWRDTGLSGEALAQKALAMFRESPFVYTLTPPRLGRDGIDDFLFVTRRGFCEHYAGSFVFLMRAAGVPARVVTGYQGGTLNPIDNYLIVRQSDAHAWAEIWLEERGWVRIDPTAAVSPRRIEFGLASLPAGEPVPLLARGEHPWLNQLYLGWDTLNNRWNQWVLGYNQQRQMELLEKLLGYSPDLRDLARITAVAISVMLLAIAVALLRKRSPRGDRLDRAYAAFRRKLARVGVVPQANEGPLDFGQRAARLRPRQAQAIRSLVREYASLRYGRVPSAARLREFEKNIRKFKA
jgi:transglutaminase-like putative cysteine protease